MQRVVHLQNLNQHALLAQQYLLLAGDELDEIVGNSCDETPDEAVRPMRMEDLQVLQE